MDVSSRSVTFFSDGELLHATLGIVPAARAAVVFAHCSANSRYSARNVFAAGAFEEAGFTTLLLDLLSRKESQSGARVPVDLLAFRLRAALDYLIAEPVTRGLPLGIFGAGAGAAAALRAAITRRHEIAALVLRGARGELERPERLAELRAPTLLLVGGDDAAALPFNRQTAAGLLCERRLEVVPGSDHLFDDPAAFARMVVQARDWFVTHLDRTTQPSAAALA